MNNQQYLNRNGCDKYFTGKVVLIFFILTLTIYLYMYFVSMPLIGNYSEGMPILDMQSGGYNHAYVMELLGVMGEKGRSVYVFPQLTVDLFFPLVYVSLLVLLLGWLLNKGNRKGKLFRYLLLVPIFTGLADYGENIASIFMIRSYPDISVGLVSFASTCTLIKSVGLIGSLLLVVLYALKIRYHSV